jgi:nondiscriminating glutamyl-tRNA synthetase
MMPPTTKTRFAPSPTGELHLGNVRTALFNALLARRDGGVFLLRIEDTDPERSQDRYATALQDDLHWLGLDWQEGPGAGGAHGPYLQSQRGDVYSHYYGILQDKGLSYPCFCSPEALESARRAQRRAGRPPRYPGTCAHLDAAQVQARLEQGLRPTLRFRVPAGRMVAFDDLVRGPQRMASDDIGDFIIRRADGTPAFFFSNAVDDALMGVTHVLRGEDHLTNTPRQLLLLEALELTAPVYGHIAMIVAADGSPLSKRQGSRSVAELRRAGFLPGAVINHLARLGHSYPDAGYMGFDGLAAGFELDRLGKAPARHDETQLQHWQKQAVAATSDNDLWAWMTQAGDNVDNVEAQVPARQAHDFVAAVRDNVLLPADARLWALRLYGAPGEYDPEACGAIRGAGAGFYRTALAEEAGEDGDFRDFAKRLGAAAGVKGKQLFMPLRAALTGTKPEPGSAAAGDAVRWQHGPELARLWDLLGPQRVRERLQAALKLCETD